jgi:hypothetical protein
MLFEFWKSVKHVIFYWILNIKKNAFVMKDFKAVLSSDYGQSS